MKTFIIFLTLIIFSTVNSYSKETIDCKSLKKFSIQYSICKTKAVLSERKTPRTTNTKASPI